MDPEEFRQAGHQLIDWIADYRQRIPELPVRAQVAPGEVKRSLPATPPDTEVSFNEVMHDLDTLIVPGVTQVQHPMHFGWFPSNASLASVLGDIASSGMGTLGISWESCPALTEVEEVVCNWLRQLTGLSEQWQGTIHDTASTACVTAMILARERASNISKNSGGLQSVAGTLVVYSTSQAHSSIAKAVQLAGFGNDNLRMIEEDPFSRAMKSSALEQPLRPISRPVISPPGSSVRWGQRAQPLWTRSRKSPLSPTNTMSGCMSTQRWRALPCCYRSVATFGRVSNKQTPSPGTPISGWAPYSTQQCSTSVTASFWSA